MGFIEVQFVNDSKDGVVNGVVAIASIALISDAGNNQTLVTLNNGLKQVLAINYGTFVTYISRRFTIFNMQ